MKRFMIALLLFVPAMSMAAGIAFINKSTIDGVDIIRSGTLYGLSTGPTGGTYEVFVTNAKSFKGDEFSKMNCTVHQELGLPMVEKFKNKVVMKTSYYETDGSITFATGYIAGITSLPANGYEVNVNNRAKDNVWNLLKCTIK